VVALIPMLGQAAQGADRPINRAGARRRARLLAVVDPWCCFPGDAKFSNQALRPDIAGQRRRLRPKDVIGALCNLWRQSFCRPGARLCSTTATIARLAVTAIAHYRSGVADCCSWVRRYSELVAEGENLDPGSITSGMS
jgi:hypothetical protein